MDSRAQEVFLEGRLYAMEGKSPSLAIEAQERREQQRAVRGGRLPIVANDMWLPSEIRDEGTTSDMEFEERYSIQKANNKVYVRKQYEAMGIKVLDEYDDLFYSVEVPEGWEIKPTDHSMWNEVIDDKGRKRASFFYKGAFYDRSAFINFEHRYSFSVMPFDFYESNASYEERKFKPWTVWITDCGKRIKELDSIQADNDKEFYNIDETLRKRGIDYLNENYPLWEDINAYWSETEG